MAGKEQCSAVESSVEPSLHGFRERARGALAAVKAKRPLAVLAVAAVLAGCGGGSSGGGDTVAPQPDPCLSQTGGGTGFALGVCFNPLATVFQPVQTSVAIGPAGYDLTLDFPADQPAGLDGTVQFTETAHRLLPGDRDVIGVLRGKAYENPRLAALTPPYSALSDFSEAWAFDTQNPGPTNQLTPALTDAGFGLWEKFNVANSFNDGYFGVWYAGKASTITNWPSGVRTYGGRVVGVLSPFGATPFYLRSFGFSAEITLTTTADGRIQNATITAPRISFRQENATTLTIEDVPLNPINLSQSPGNAVDGPVNGTLASGAGSLATVADAQFEANWFGVTGDEGREIAGRLRFTTSNGLVGVAAFGARATN